MTGFRKRPDILNPVRVKVDVLNEFNTVDEYKNE
jgi:hypothetical protein